MDVENQSLISKTINSQPTQPTQTSRFTIAIWSILLVLTVSGTNISLPLFVKELTNVPATPSPSPSIDQLKSYFVLFIGSLCFMLSFNTFSYFETTQFQATKKAQVHMFLIGLFNVLSDICVVISCGENRTPVMIQGILSQSNFIFTFVFSRVLKHDTLIKKQNIGVVLVMIGIVTSLIPMITKTTDLTLINLGWSSLFCLGYAFASLSIVYSDYSFKEYDMPVFKQLALSCNYQFGFYCVLLPCVLLSHNANPFTSIKDFGELFYYFFTTFVGLTGTLYIAFYIGVYISVSFVLKHMSANYSKLVESLVCVVTVTFWLTFPWLNDRQVELVEICLDYLAGVIVVCGIVVYVKLWDAR